MIFLKHCILTVFHFLIRLKYSDNGFDVFANNNKKTSNLKSRILPLKTVPVELKRFGTL